MNLSLDRLNNLQHGLLLTQRLALRFMPHMQELAYRLWAGLTCDGKRKFELLPFHAVPLGLLK